MAPRQHTALLYLNFIADEEKHRRKLAGIVRYARARGFGVAAVPLSRCAPQSFPALLARINPAGCIVEGSELHIRDVPLSLFGKVPFVVLDPAIRLSDCRALEAVVCDNGAVGSAAFRELSANAPACFAAVPSGSLAPWSAERLETFKAHCASIGEKCLVFPGRCNEDPGRRVARLADWLGGLPRHSAIFAANDWTASHVVSAAAAIGLHIPKDITLVGVDGMPETADDAAPLRVSTIQLDFELAGYLAAKSLVGLLAAGGAGKDAADGAPAQARDGKGKVRYAFGPLFVMRKESTRGYGRSEPRILQAVETIRREACDGLSAAALAARFPGSRKHFERRFREAMGHSILDEIIHVRLERVKEMLANTEKSISAITDFCGFSTERELQKLFKGRIGMSMRQWRTNHGKS